MIKITDHYINFFEHDETPIVYVSQGDTGRVLRFTAKDCTIPSECTADWWVTKPSGLAVYQTGTVNGNSVDVHLTGQSIIESGESSLFVRITKDDEVVTSFKVALMVKESPVEGVESRTEINVIDQAVQEAIAEIGETLDTTLSVQNKAAEAKSTGDALATMLGTFAQPMQPGAYKEGDIATYKYGVYRCISAVDTSGTDIIPFLPFAWEKIDYIGTALSGNDVFYAFCPAYNSSMQYHKGDYVWRPVNSNRYVYICLQDIPAPGEEWTNSHWDIVNFGKSVGGRLRELAEEQLEIGEDEDGFITIEPK